MTIAGLASTPWLMQAAVGTHDTLLVRQLPAQRSTMELVFFYASGLSSLLILTLLVMALVVVFWMRRAAISAGERVDQLLVELRPLLDQATETGQSIRKAADLIQTEVAHATEGAHDAGVRVKRTVGELADRVDDFNELLGKVHSRADTVVDVAGTAMDGLAWGKRKLAERRARKRVKKKS